MLLYSTHTDIIERINAALPNDLGLSSDETYTVEAGALDDVLQRKATRRITIAVAPVSGEIDIESADSPDDMSVRHQFVVGIHVESVREPGAAIRGMQLVDAIVRLFHGTDAGLWLYMVTSYNVGASTQSTAGFEITLIAEGPFQ